MKRRLVVIISLMMLFNSIFVLGGIIDWFGPGVPPPTGPGNFSRWLPVAPWLYNISNLLYFNDSQLSIAINDTDTHWPILGPYLYNSSGNLTFNESYLNNTIENLDTDTVWSINGPYLYNNTGTLDFNESYLNNTIEALDTFYPDTWWPLNGPWLYNNTGKLDFNESQLATIYYSPTSLQLVTGTINGGTLQDVNHTDGAYDDFTFNFTEAAGAPALDLRMNFTNIPDFNDGVIRYRTSPIAGDYPVIQLWDYDEGNWEDYPLLAETETFSVVTQPVYDSDEHLNNSIVQMRLYKASTGNINNHYYVDWIAISKGFGTPAGQEIDPVWTSDKHYYLNYTEIWALNSSWNYTIDTDTHVAGDTIYLYNDTTTMYFNETRLNNTIETLTFTPEMAVAAVGNWSADMDDYYNITEINWLHYRYFWNVSNDIDNNLTADEIDESKIGFTTVCTSSQKYYLNGNDLACNNDDFLTQEEVEDYINGLMNSGNGIDWNYIDVANYGDFTFDCSEVASSGLSCSGEDMIHADTSSYAPPDPKGYLTNITTDTYGHVQTGTRTEVGFHETYLSGDGNITVVITI